MEHYSGVAKRKERWGGERERERKQGREGRERNEEEELNIAYNHSPPHLGHNVAV